LCPAGHGLPATATRAWPNSPHAWPRRTNGRTPRAKAWAWPLRYAAIVVPPGRRGRSSRRRATFRGVSRARRRLARRRFLAPAVERVRRPPGGEAGRPVAAGCPCRTPSLWRSSLSTPASRNRTGCSAAMSASRTAGTRPGGPRDAPSRCPMAGLPHGDGDSIAAIVEKHTGFSHSLALQPTGAAILVLQSRSLSARPRRLSLALGFIELHTYECCRWVFTV
jgi:hypothetical protein